MDQILVRAPADIFYMSGHAFQDAGTAHPELQKELKLNVEDPTLEISPDEDLSPQHGSEAVNLTKKWLPGELRMKWLVVVGCYVLGEKQAPFNVFDLDLKPHPMASAVWGNLTLNRLGLHGMLGWSGHGWAGEDFSREIVRLGSTDNETPIQAVVGTDTVDLAGAFVTSESIQAGDVLLVGKEENLVATVIDSPTAGLKRLKMSKPFTTLPTALSIVQIKATITRGWRAGWRTPAEIAKKVSGTLGGIKEKQPAYVVFDTFETSEKFAPESLTQLADMSTDSVRE